MNPFRNVTGKLIAGLALLACLTLRAAPAVGNGYHLSGVTGIVHGDILFHDWNVLAMTLDGDVVADFLTDPAGNFTVDLKPGTYVVVAYITNVSSEHPLVLGTPVTVTVQKKTFATATLTITLPPL